MNTEKIDVIQFGATGPVNERFREYVADQHMPFKLVGVVPVRPRPGVKNLGQLGTQAGFDAGVHREVKVLAIDEALNFEAPVIFSGASKDAAAEYEDALAKDRLLVSNASANRMRSDVALANAYFSGGQIDKLLNLKDSSRIVTGGNCMANIICTALAPLMDLGIEKLSISTRQGWSGKGLKELPLGLGSDLVEIPGDEKEKLETEPNKLLATDRHYPKHIEINASPYRGAWLLGHWASVSVIFTHKLRNSRDITDLWQDFESPDFGLQDSADILPQQKPIEVLGPGEMMFKFVGNKKKRHLNKRVLVPQYPMKVMAKFSAIAKENDHRATIEVAGDNLGIGAAGLNLMNALYARAKGQL